MFIQNGPSHLRCWETQKHWCISNIPQASWWSGWSENISCKTNYIHINDFSIKPHCVASSSYKHCAWQQAIEHVRNFSRLLTQSWTPAPASCTCLPLQNGSLNELIDPSWVIRVPSYSQKILPMSSCWAIFEAEYLQTLFSVDYFH